MNLDATIQTEALKLKEKGVSEPRVQHKAVASVFGRYLAVGGALVILLMAGLTAIPLVRGDGVPVGLVLVLLIFGLFGLLVFGVGATMVSRESGGVLATLAGYIVAGIGKFRGQP
jgi:hypothetical protein